MPAHRLGEMRRIRQRMPARSGRRAQFVVEIDEVRAGDMALLEVDHPGRPSERPTHIENDGGSICRKSCSEFVTIEQERYHLVRIPHWTGPRNFGEGGRVISPIAQVERTLKANNGTVEAHG